MVNQKPAQFVKGRPGGAQRQQKITQLPVVAVGCASKMIVWAVAKIWKININTSLPTKLQHEAKQNQTIPESSMSLWKRLLFSNMNQAVHFERPASKPLRFSLLFPSWEWSQTLFPLCAADASIGNSWRPSMWWVTSYRPPLLPWHPLVCCLLCVMIIQMVSKVSWNIPALCVVQQLTFPWPSLVHRSSSSPCRFLHCVALQHGKRRVGPWVLRPSRHDLLGLYFSFSAFDQANGGLAWFYLHEVNIRAGMRYEHIEHEITVRWLFGMDDRRAYLHKIGKLDEPSVL